MRKFLSNTYFIHGLILLGLFALWGVIETGILYILFGMAISFLGAICGGFIRVIDEIRKQNK